ncbi:MAG TPA: glycosyltransferase family 2 protein [Bosea sp. (in: a-proteobacteria)]|jgi:cellulose synthase/poly-beta-1,6-N-acetylglucosamine synthase-like glycosyltransferase|uniref:glycosyltransferase family 2 protein n=1 Tax=Bosea sp. (in: a-proteobacteria) TaxID=1871050 RepID=UPI002E106AD9|nr:glycosyltransferase family 2 protein [Bosea sp. (in: a-proteobacteria)]
MDGCAQAPTGLPVEIAFLARHGVASAALALVAQQAGRRGTEPARDVLARGLIDEDGFYRALAAELGLPFHTGEFDLMSGGDHAAILRGGIAPAAGEASRRLRFVLAPEGPALRRMLEAGPRQRDDIAIVTPRRFGDALRRANGATLARRVADLDEAGLGRDSARTGATRGQRIAVALGAASAAIGGVVAPLETFFGIASLLGPVFLGLILLRLAAAIERPAPDLWQEHRWRVDDARLPVYTVAVPLHREEAVLLQLLAALAALDYPVAKLDIRLLVEADDTGMRTALAQIALPPHVSVTVVPPGPPRTKPRALNLALLEARGALFTIFDAEDIPDPQQLRMAAARFLRAPDELACLQARLVIDHADEGWLPALFALEYAGLFEVLNPGLLRSGLPIMLGGTSNHFRTQALRAIGGWDAWNVTEDADLGVRLVRSGYRMGDLPSDTREEAPLTLPAWLRQRSRWIKGYMQTLVTHSRAPIRTLHEAGLPATLAFLSLGLGTVATALVYPAFAAATFIALREGSLLSPTGAFSNLTSAVAVTVWTLGVIALFLPPAIGALRRRAPRLLLFLPLLPFYYGLVCIAAWMALYEYRARRFAWNKTTHGLARQRAPLAAPEPPYR